MARDGDDSVRAPSADEADSLTDDEPVIGGARPRGTWPAVAGTSTSATGKPAGGDLAAREAEEFLVPSWTAGVEQEATQAKTDRGGKLLREIIETALLALLVFLAVRATLQNYLVEGYSMYPALDNGQHVLVNKVGYAEVNMDRLTDFIPFVDAEEGDVRQVFGEPGRGDIIVFQSAGASGNDLIKRVIGLPGERVAIENGQIYIDGLVLDEPYITEVWSDTRAEITIPARHYYVLGDNRNSSQDSRSGRVGLVPRERIVGKALLRYWPIGEFGPAPNGGAELTDARMAETGGAGP